MNLKRISGLALLLATAGLIGVQPSCSVVVNDFKEQCQTTQDCVDLANRQPRLPNGEPSVTGLVCSDKHVCEPEKGCHSNAECQVAHNGQPYICRASDRTCQSLILKSPTDPDKTICDVLADPADFKNENTVWLGASVFYKEGSNQGLELVRQDVNGFAKGLPPATATSTARRPIGFVYCEADGTLEEGAQHLINDLELPVVITSLDTTSEITLLTKYSIANGKKVFQLSTSAGGPLLKTVDNKGQLIDLVLINENYDIETVELVREYYVPLLRGAAAALGPKELPRVAVIHSSTPTYANTAIKIVSAFEAAKVTSDVRDFGYGDSENPTGTPGAYASVVSKVLDFKPHVIVVLGDKEIGPSDDKDNPSEGIDIPIEKGWAAAAGTQPHPQWLGILGSVGQLPDDMRKLDQAAQLDWGSRTLFIQQHYDFQGELFTSYIGQLKQLIGEDPYGVLDVELSSPYNEFLREGAYLTVYSIALLAAQGKPFNGETVAAAARTFGDHNPVHFPIGRENIYPALQSIATTAQPIGIETFQQWTGFDANGFATYTFADDVACLTPDTDPETGDPVVGALQPTGGVFEVSGALTNQVLLDGCVKP